MTELTTTTFLSKVQDIIINSVLKAQEEFKQEVARLSEQLARSLMAEKAAEKGLEEARGALQAALHKEKDRLDADRVTAIEILKKFQWKFDCFGIDLCKVDPSIVNWTQAVHRATGGMSARHRSEFYWALDLVHKCTDLPWSQKEQETRCPDEFRALQEADVKLRNVRLEAETLNRKLSKVEPPKEVLEVPEDLGDLPDEILWQIVYWLEEEHPQAIKAEENGHLGVHWTDYTVSLPGLTFSFTLY